MPTYDYQCEACAHAFEQFQSMTAAALKKCPKCGKNRLRRLIGTGAGLIFKGSGFYITDYRSDSYNESAKKDAGVGSGTDAGKAAGSESAKPAAKAADAPSPAAKPSESKPLAAAPSPSSPSAKGASSGKSKGSSK